MKSVMFALVCVVAMVVAQEPQDDVVPADGAAPQDVGSVDCRSDEECQLFDNGASCKEFMCECTGDDRSRYCVGELRTVSKLVVSFIFARINCDELNDAIRQNIRSEVGKKIVYDIVDYDIVCGSVIVVMGVEVAANDLDTALQAMTDGMTAVQQEIPVLARSPMTVEATYGNDTKQCVVENAASTVFLEEKICFPTCMPAHTRVLTNGTYTCVADTAPIGSDDDDSITSEQIAAAAVGSILVVGIVGGLAYHFSGTGKPNNDVPTNEPFTEEKPADVEAQDVTV